MADLYPGSQTIVYAMKETTYGTPRKPASADAMFTISENLQGAEEREFRPDRSGQADHIERVVGRKSATWDITKLILPNGSAGTAPDDTHLWEAGFGHVSIGGTAVEYILATLHNTSLTIRRGVRVGQDGGIAGAADFQDHVFGAIVNNVQISWGGQGNNGLAQVQFSGEAKEYGHTGNTSLSEAVSTTDTGADVANAKHFSFGSVIKRSTPAGTAVDTFGGSGALLTTANYTSNNIVFAETLDNSASNLDIVAPYNPTATTAGTPIHARVGKLSIDGGATFIKHLGGQVTLEQNTSLLMEEVGEDSASQVLRSDRRNISFSLDFLMKKDETWLLGDVRANTAKDIEVTLGSETGKRLHIVMPNAEYNFTPADIPEQEVARISLEGVAMASNVNDALKLRFI